MKRELRRLQETVNTQQVQPRLNGLTPLPIAAGRVTFIRQVTQHGNIHLLGQTFRVGKRLRGEYLKAVLDTQRGRLTVYRDGRVFKRWPYKLLNK